MCQKLDPFWAGLEAPRLGGWNSDPPTFSEVTSLLDPFALVVLSHQSFSPVSHMLHTCATLLNLSGFIYREMVVSQLCIRNEIAIHMLKTFYFSLKLFVFYGANGK